MEILAMGDNWGLDRMEPFWDNEYIGLDYVQEKFNNLDDLKLWKDQGYTHSDSHYTGALCDMRSLQPTWNDDIISWFYKKYNVNDIGTSYYRMGTGVVLPMHGDIYARYRQIFRCELHNIKRVVVFLVVTILRLRVIQLLTGRQETMFGGWVTLSTWQLILV